MMIFEASDFTRLSKIWLVVCTLKQTQSENGRVTMTMAQENAVRSQPQIPIPISFSWAVKETNLLSDSQCIFAKLILRIYSTTYIHM